MTRKTLSAVSAAVLSLALLGAPAFAQGFNDAAEAGLAKLGVQAPPADMLTTEQVAQITNILASSDTDTMKRAQIDKILGNEATATGRLGVAQLRDSAAADMAALGIDTEPVDMLTLSQLAQIENVMASADSDSTKKMRVEEIIGGEATETQNLGVTQLQDSAAADLAALGVDADGVDTLTLSQLAQIENVMGTNESPEAKKLQVQKIIGN